VSWRRLLAGGVVATALTGMAGGVLELVRFGRTEDAAARRVETHLQRQFDAMIRAVSDIAARITQQPDTAKALGMGLDGARSLFDLVARERRASPAPNEIAVTIYDSASGLARAWTGTPSDVPPDRIAGAASLFVIQTSLGLRLVHLQPIMTAEGGRVGSVATEHVLSPAPAASPIAPAEFTIQTPLAPATVLTRVYGAGEGEGSRAGAVPLRAPTGELLAEAQIDPADLRRSRHEWRRRVCAAMLVIIGITLVLLVGPLLDRRATRDAFARVDVDAVRSSSSGREPLPYVRATLAALLLMIGGGALWFVAVGTVHGGWPPAPAIWLIAGSTAAAVISLLAEPVVRLRAAMRKRRYTLAEASLQFVVWQLVAGVACTALILGFQRILEAIVTPVASVDLRHFSLYPWTAPRLVFLASIVALHLAVLWGATLLLVSAVARWRLSRRMLTTRVAVVGLWMAPAAVVALVAAAREWPVSSLAVVLSALACGMAAFSAPRVSGWYRRATVVARILALLLAFLLPTLLLYPSMDYFAERTTRELIQTQYAVQAQNYVQTVQQRMREARYEIDRLPDLLDLVRSDHASTSETSASNAAYAVWRQTVLARERLTSSVELYDVNSKLVGEPFSLNVPQSTPTPPQGTSGCGWDEFAEVAPVGAEERRMLHAERKICTMGVDGIPTVHGAIVLHVVLEYETLPFITSQNPYFEIFRRANAEPREDTPGANVEVAIYGWSLQPLYTSGSSAWPITDDLFRRIYASRDPFWATATAGGVNHRVYFSNDRARIFAIGYPVLTPFDHFVHLAELTTFGGTVFLIVLFGTAFFTRVARDRPRVGRALLREIRASFYRKLFLAFVLAAIIPVLILALVIRAYFANLLLAELEAEAARTAAVAQRVIEEADTLSRRSGEEFGPLSDDVMAWIEQVIDQDVNVFEGARLVATSERDLFASGVLPTRTPEDVYRAIVLERLPSFVRQDAIGGFSYLLAAAPVRPAGEETLLTIPLALRQREIEREKGELDRGVHLAALFFVLLGAGIGLSMAERIADPVRRLTRATGRIARGDFDARIAVKSADELRRLVDAFNSMAAELKAQRGQLERTHRLEAWAEMARQVAHEIKNPLTPIQLSAEHLQRVHADRGEPMGPVLENCVNSILGQVRLLRRISSEFSSFASSPTARPAPVNLPELIAEVVDPYRTGLQGRITIENRVPAALPAVHVDRTLVARALVNIVENALHAMPGPGTLAIDGAAESQTVRVTVTDTGVGMDEEALGRVFEPYFSTKTTGTGLGLPIARRNIELNGGSITVASTRGVGTTVTVRLPVVPDQAATVAGKR
jgi:signal transduction histidine kinase